MSNTTIPAPYSPAEQQFEREIRDFFGGTWCPPDRRPTREMPAVRLEMLRAACVEVEGR